MPPSSSSSPGDRRSWTPPTSIAISSRASSAGATWPAGRGSGSGRSSRTSPDAPTTRRISTRSTWSIRTTWSKPSARHEVPDAGAICRMLRSPEVDNSWLEIPLIDLAGGAGSARRCPRWWTSSTSTPTSCWSGASTALAKIGDPEASRLVRAAYLPASDTFKIFSSSVFGSIKHEESEEAILDLLRSERRPDLSHDPLRGALRPLLRTRDPGGDVGDRVRLRHLLRPPGGAPAAGPRGVGDRAPGGGALEGRAHEGGTAARGEARRDGARRQTLSGNAGEGARPLREGRKAEAARGHRADALPPAAPTSIRRTGQKVGRNDPCPCGSGKKYKKCCGPGDPRGLTESSRRGPQLAPEVAPMASSIKAPARARRGVAGRSRPPAGSLRPAAGRASCRAACAPSRSARRP